MDNLYYEMDKCNKIEITNHYMGVQIWQQLKITQMKWLTQMTEQYEANPNQGNSRRIDKTLRKLQ